MLFAVPVEVMKRAPAVDPFAPLKLAADAPMKVMGPRFTSSPVALFCESVKIPLGAGDGGSGKALRVRLS